MITNEQIEQLEIEAGAHGDTAQVEMCRAALNGDEAAQARCAAVIEAASTIDPDAQCPEHGCARWRCDADHA